MKKSIILVLILVLITSNLLIAGASQPVKIEVNGKAVAFNDSEPIEKNGDIFVPVATIATYLGINYQWIGETQSINFEKDGVELLLKLGNHGSFVQNGRTYVPLKFVSEAFGSKVVVGDKEISINTATLREEKSVYETTHIDELKKEKFMDYANPNASKHPVYSYIEGDYIRYGKIENISFGKTTDLPIQVGDYTIFSVELGQRKGIDYIIIKQRIPHQSTNGLALTIVDKDWNTFRTRNSIENFSEVITDDNTCITYYPVMSLNDRTFEGLNYLDYKLPNDFYIVLNSPVYPNALVLEGKGGKMQ